MTPMQKFKKWFDENRQNALNHEIGKKITEMIEEEKQVIIDTYNDADKKACAIANRINADLFEHNSEDGVEYYNSKFKNN